MNIIVNSEFKPYTFAQMLEPYKIIKDERQKIEEDYSTLMSQAEAFKNYANQIENREAKGVHQSYMDALRQASDEFSSSTTSMDRRALRELKRRYYDEILPIANAAEQVKQAASDRDKISIRHPSAIYKKNGYSIDKAMAGESANNEYVVGDDILNKTKEDVQALVAASIDYDARSRQLQDITKPYFVFEQGFDENTLSRGLNYSILENELSGTEKQIRSIKESARQAAGYSAFDDEGKAQLDAMIDRGIRQGGTKTFTTIENKNFESPSLSYSRYSSGRGSGSSQAITSLGLDNAGNEYFKVGQSVYKKAPDGSVSKLDAKPTQTIEEKVRREQDEKRERAKQKINRQLDSTTGETQIKVDRKRKEDGTIIEGFDIVASSGVSKDDQGNPLGRFVPIESLTPKNGQLVTDAIKQAYGVDINDVKQDFDISYNPESGDIRIAKKKNKPAQMSYVPTWYSPDYSSVIQQFSQGDGSLLSFGVTPTKNSNTAPQTSNKEVKEVKGAAAGDHNDFPE